MIFIPGGIAQVQNEEMSTLLHWCVIWCVIFPGVPEPAICGDGSGVRGETEAIDVRSVL